MTTHAISGTRRPFSHGPRRRLIIAGLVVVGVALIAGSLVAGPLRSASGPGPGSATATDGRLARLEEAVAREPDNAELWAELGGAYVDHARVNSDPSAYPKAERALDRSLALNGDGNWQALAAQGFLAAGRHDFATALRLSEQARVLQPQSAFILGILVDSLTELGRYPEAVDAAQAMVDLRPDLASYARVSYQRELHGDVPGAIEAMNLALQASARPEDRAFALYHLGELEWQRGNVEAASGHYRTALRVDPTAMPAVAGLGKVTAAGGDVDEAIASYERAVAGFPDPDALKELGELHLLAGDQAGAEKRFRQAGAENAKQAAGGVNVDLEIALFSADRRQDLDKGLAAARKEWERRQSIHVADALAWQLFAHGQYEEALTYAHKALELGTRSASFHFHRAEILRALGDVDAARADYREAIALNPNFSFLHGRTAKEALAALPGRPD